ncbi:endoglucanase V-like protein [Lactarius quietus]|nr:endoglucanase V-like protein [Lactarius quietus]
MKSTPFITTISILAAAVHGTVVKLDDRQGVTGGYLQVAGGNASFTQHAGCAAPACGQNATGFTAAISQLTYGAPPNLGPGDACGRCFSVTANADPFSNFTGPFNTVVVKAQISALLIRERTDALWCSQTQANPLNQYNMTVHFDLCTDTGAAAAFFPTGHEALTGTYTEVSCQQWAGTDGPPLFNSACLLGENAPNWPSTGCGNQGEAP